jgi:hypothetical protein
MLSGLRADLRRRVTRYLRPGPVAVCECNAWDNFMIRALCPDAIRVPITPGEPAARVLAAITRSARVVLMHIDASCTDGFLEREASLFDRLAERGVVTLNTQATDVRKRTLHERCAAHGLRSAAASRDGPADERVIIKTNLNSAGVPERRLAALGGAVSDRFARELNHDIRDPEGYRICRRADVSDAAWLDPTLAIERYIENAQGTFYRIFAVGPATVVAQIWTDLEIKKLLSRAHRREYFFFWTVAGEHIALGDVTEEAVRAVHVARRAATAMQTEFHGTDCVMDADGSIVPIDVNKTPYWGNAVRPGLLEHLRLGLEYLQAGRAIS